MAAPRGTMIRPGDTPSERPEAEGSTTSGRDDGTASLVAACAGLGVRAVRGFDGDWTALAGRSPVWLVLALFLLPAVMLACWLYAGRPGAAGAALIVDTHWGSI